ncbi:MAG TPA: hypothetical protein VIO94_15955 [Phenylobacterium sp.]
MGDPRRNGEGPDVLQLHGMEFPKGEWVGPISGVLEAKLPGNDHFQVSSEDMARPVRVEPAEAPASLFVAFDPDGDGQPGGSTSSPEKDALMAELDDLGVKYDRRLGPARLQALLEVAKFERGDD